MSYAAPTRPIVGDQRVQRALARQEERGKEPDINRVLAKHLAAGRGLSAQVVNKYNDGKYSDGRSTEPITFGSLSTHDKLDERFGRGSAANIAGLKGAELGKGDVYMGATKVEIPGYSRTDHQSGHTATPGSTRYDITVLPRWMVNQPSAQSSNDSASGASAQTPVEPGAGLLAAREAYDRANTYTQGGETAASGGSFASPLDLGKSGGDLFNAIAADGQRGLDDYERRFVPRLFANANLTAQEIGYAGQSAIANLPDDLKLPEYSKIFPDRAQSKGGLYKWLEKRIA